MARPSAPVLLLGLLTCSCGGFSPASELVKPPEFNPAGQTQCQVKKSQEKPLIVEWPSADRAELEATAKSGTVVVAYNGCEMRVLSRCRAPGKYGYVPVTPKADTVTIKNDDDLYANIPVYAAKFEAKLAQSGQLNVAMTMVGRYATDQVEVKQDQLTGACQGATHVIAGLTVGAFEFFAGAGAEVGAGVEVMGAGAGAKSAAKRETLTRDGSAEACAKASEADPRAPEGCGAMLRVEVIPVLAPRPILSSAPVGSVSAATHGMSQRDAKVGASSPSPGGASSAPPTAPTASPATQISAPSSGRMALVRGSGLTVLNGVEVDWARGALSASGNGPARSGLDPGSSRLAAERAALQDARRKLTSAVASLRTSAGELGALMTQDAELARRMARLVDTAKLINTRYYSDFSVDVIVALPIADLEGALSPTP